MVEIQSIGIAAEPYEVKAKILWNPSVEEIKWYATENPKTFIFSFLTGNVEDVIDYSELLMSVGEAADWKKRVVTPMYIGHLENPEQVAKLRVEQSMQPWLFGEHKFWRFE